MSHFKSSGIDLPEALSLSLWSEMEARVKFWAAEGREEQRKGEGRAPSVFPEVLLKLTSNIFAHALLG